MNNEFFTTFKAWFEDVTDEQYHANKERLSASGMKTLKRSPLHFISKVEKTTDAMVFGSAYHTYILQPEEFEERYYVLNETEIMNTLAEKYKAPRSTNDYKAWLADEYIKAGTRIVIDEQMMMRMAEMKRVLMSDFYIRSLLTNGEAEKAIYFDFTTANGVVGKGKIKPDYLKRKKRLIIDLKTCVDASDNAFPRHAAEMDYQIQAALYSDVIGQMEGEPYEFIFIAQEKDTPYATNVFKASEQFKAVGRYEYEMLIGLHDSCKKRDKWPGYKCFCPNKYGINELDIPPYKVKSLDYFEY